MNHALVDLVLPVACAGCRAAPIDDPAATRRVDVGRDGPRRSPRGWARAGPALCADCRQLLAGPHRHRPEPVPPGLPVVAVAAGYRGPVRQAVLAYKERGRLDLARPLATALAGAVRVLLSGLPPGGVGRAPPVLLVPVPSRPAAARARGGDHMARLARLVAARLRAGGVPARSVRLLNVRPGVRDSAGLSAADRLANLAGAFRLRRTGRRWTGRRRPAGVVVLDDVVTTGATAAEATRTLQRAGFPVLGVAALAGTARRGRPPGASRGSDATA